MLRNSLGICSLSCTRYSCHLLQKRIFFLQPFSHGETFNSIALLHSMDAVQKSKSIEGVYLYLCTLKASQRSVPVLAQSFKTDLAALTHWALCVRDHCYELTSIDSPPEGPEEFKIKISSAIEWKELRTRYSLEYEGPRLVGATVWTDGQIEAESYDLWGSRFNSKYDLTGGNCQNFVWMLFDQITLTKRDNRVSEAEAASWHSMPNTASRIKRVAGRTTPFVLVIGGITTVSHVVCACVAPYAIPVVNIVTTNIGQIVLRRTINKDEVYTAKIKNSQKISIERIDEDAQYEEINLPCVTQVKDQLATQGGIALSEISEKESTDSDVPAHDLVSESSGDGCPPHFCVYKECPFSGSCGFQGWSFESELVAHYVEGHEALFIPAQSLGSLCNDVEPITSRFDLEGEGCMEHQISSSGCANIGQPATRYSIISRATFEEPSNSRRFWCSDPSCRSSSNKFHGFTAFDECESHIQIMHGEKPSRDPRWHLLDIQGTLETLSEDPNHTRAGRLGLSRRVADRAVQAVHEGIERFPGATEIVAEKFDRATDKAVQVVHAGNERFPGASDMVVEKFNRHVASRLRS